MVAQNFTFRGKWSRVIGFARAWRAFRRTQVALPRYFLHDFAHWAESHDRALYQGLALAMPQTAPKSEWASALSARLLRWLATAATPTDSGSSRQKRCGEPFIKPEQILNALTVIGKRLGPVATFDSPVQATMGLD